MKEGIDKKRVKSFSLKEENATKVEDLAYTKKEKQSKIVDKMIEEYSE